MYQLEAVTQSIWTCGQCDTFNFLLTSSPRYLEIWLLHSSWHLRLFSLFLFCLCFFGRGSVVGIATGYGLDGPGFESQSVARFSAPVQTGPGAHPASCTMGTWSFSGVKSGRGVTLTPHPLLVPWSRKGRAIPLLPLWAIRPVQSLSAWTEPQCLYKGDLYLYLFIYVLQYTRVCVFRN